MNFIKTLPLHALPKHLHFLPKRYNSNTPSFQDLLQKLPDNVKSNMYSVAQITAKFQDELDQSNREKQSLNKEVHRLTSELTSMTTQRDFQIHKLNQKVEEYEIIALEKKELSHWLKLNDFALKELTTERDALKLELDEKKTLLNSLIKENTSDIQTTLEERDQTIRLLQREIQRMRPENIITKEEHEKILNGHEMILNEKLLRKEKAIKYWREQFEESNIQRSRLQESYRQKFILAVIVSTAVAVYSFQSPYEKDYSVKKVNYVEKKAEGLNYELLLRKSSHHQKVEDVHTHKHNPKCRTEKHVHSTV